MFTITDFTDTIGVKIFVQNAEVPELKDAIKKGAFIKVKGKTTVDAFDHDLTVMSVWGIKKITDFRTGRQDTSPVKRVELHCHTKMSDMDGVTDAARLVPVSYTHLGIPEPEKRVRQYPHEFSGGMRQRVMIAIAFACDPKILICDEPTTALDVTIQGQILDIIKNLQKKNQTSVIMITHDLGVVANIAQKIAVMYSGIIVESGTCEDIFYRPRHPYTCCLLYTSRCV